MVTKLKKEETAVELREKLGRTKLAIVADYRGLTVAEITTLRRRLRPENADFKVAKNTLLRRAVEGNDAVKDLEPHLKGPTGLALGYSESPTIAKILGDFIREVKKPEVKIRGGLLDGKWITAEQVKSLADLPSREVLLAKLLGTMQAPLSGLVGAMSGLPRNVVYALEQIRKQKAEAGGASAAPAAEAAAPAAGDVIDAGTAATEPAGEASNGER